MNGSEKLVFRKGLESFDTWYELFYFIHTQILKIYMFFGGLGHCILFHESLQYVSTL